MKSLQFDFLPTNQVYKEAALLKKENVMFNEQYLPGQRVERISIIEFLKSVGIQTATLADDILNTDAAYGEEWCAQAADRLACVSELCYLFFKAAGGLGQTLEVELPETIRGVVVGNPHYLSDRIEFPAEGKEPSADELGDIPF